MKSNKLKREPKYIAKFKAFPYQQEAVDAVKDLEYAAIFHEQGLGKTKIAIDVLLYWLSECSMDTALIVTKKQLVANWVNEFKDHTSIKPAVLNTDKNNKCKECGWSFRRTVRTYKNTYVRWVCSGRNGRGADSCPNKTVVDEEELIEVLQEYFTNVLRQKKKVIDYVIKEFQRVYKAKDENVEYEKELNAELAKLQKTRQKYMDMYTDDLISREELNEKIGGIRQEIERLENELKMVSYHLTKGEQLENILNRTFKEIEDITDVHQMTNQQLKRLIQKIEVDKDGNVDIYLRLLGDLGLDENILISNDQT